MFNLSLIRVQNKFEKETKPGAFSRATSALFDRDINIESVSQSLMQVNMQFVISHKNYKDAIITLNQALCLND